MASGFQAPAGVVVNDSGTIFISDWKAGTVTQVAPNGRRTILLRRLDGPAGLAVDHDGSLLIVEERGGRVLRRDRSGTLAVLHSRITRPRWIAADPGGAIYVSAGRERILQLMPSGALRTFAEGLRGLEGLSYADHMLYAALRRLTTDRGRDASSVVRIPILPDGSPGPMEAVMRRGRSAPVGLAVDLLGALVVTTHGRDRSDDDDLRGGRVMRRLTTGEVVTLATGLHHPLGLAFEATGHMLVVEGEPARRLLRFRAPPAPLVAAPPFTNQSPVALAGQVAPGHLVQVFPEGQFASPLAAARADSRSGAFRLSVPLVPNIETSLSFATTAAAGSGLTSAPALHAIRHDNHAPFVAILEPSTALHVRDVLTVRVRAVDEGSGVEAIAVMLDDTLATIVHNPDPAQPLESGIAIGPPALAEGPRTLTVTATDRAGNAASAAQLVVVDRTSPDTRIASGPGGEIAAGAVTFVVEGTDLLAPSVELAWRLDEGSWSQFSLGTSIALSGLASGVHRFEVKARDLAGNEDPTPAMETFTVRSLRIRILEPAAGAIVTTDSVIVRAIVEGGTGEVSVTVPLPLQFGVEAVTAAVQGDTVAMLVPTDPSLTTLTLIATDASGATARADVPIAVAGAQTLEPSVDLWPSGGLAPLSVRIGLRGWSGFRVTIDIDGDGTHEFDGQPEADDFYTRYERAGVYVPMVRITTPDGDVLTRRGVVEVYDPVVLDARLQDVWNGFKAALRGADVQTAVAFIAAERRGAWAEYFSVLSPDVLADVDLVFTTMTLVEVGYGGAQYEMVAERDGLLYSYAVWFRVDDDGRWRLWRF